MLEEDEPVLMHKIVHKRHETTGVSLKFHHLMFRPRHDHAQDAVPEEDQPELMDKISKGQFTMRIMYEQFANITKMGPMSQVRTRALP